jgi:cold shock CspA family protein
MAEQERIQGTVKWFSNKKGYGFITTQDGVDVFCHQTQVDCGDAYRSLNKGWIVEFNVEKDEEDDNGKPKATRVTAVGGGPCTGPAGNKSTRRKQHAKRQQQQRTNRDGDADAASSPPLPWHDMLDDDVKSVLHKAKRISTETGTLDVSVDKTIKVKLGTAGYASMAHADGIVAEGTFACTPEGTVSLHWARAISFQNGEWQTTSVSDLLSTFSLVDDNVERVGRNETPATLWGSDKPNPRKALEANGFQMRKVYLQRSGRNR